MSDSVEPDEVNRALAVLESADIDNLTIDVAHKRVMVEASSYWSGREHHNRVTFEGVASFYAVLGAKEARFEPPAADRFAGDTLVGDCDGASYLPEGIGQVDIHAPPGTFVSTWVGDFTTRPNFLITINQFIILLEARLVRIDDMTFEVGYVSDTPPQET